MKIFKLPDLGEGLQEAEIVAWHVKAGDEVQADQLLLSVETAKAVVEVPTPYPGRVAKLFGQPHDVVHVGAPLVAFEGEGGEGDAGSVVGSVQVGATVVKEAPVALGPGLARIKAMPAVRALAQRLDVDLAMVTPSGPDGSITAADVQRVAKLLAEVGPAEPLRGVRRAMAQNMALAHNEVVPLGAGYLFVSLFVDVHLVSSQRKPTYAVASLKVMYFYFVAQMPNKHHFI